MPPLFQERENRVYAALGTALFLNTLFFIALQVNWLTIIKLPFGNTFHYALFVILGIGSIGAIAYFSKTFLWKKQLGLLLLITLPAVATITYGLSASRHFHLLFQIGVGIYLITAGILLSAHAIAHERATSPERIPGDSPKQWFKKQGLPTILAVLFLTGIFFSFGIHRLGLYAAVDEPLWLYGRIGSYWKNIGDGEFFKTDVSDKPGITVSMLSGAALLQYDPDDYDDWRRDGEVFHRQGMAEFFAAFRFPIVLAAALFLPIFYFLLERLMGRSGALLSYAFLTTSPILVGVTKIINPDAILWIFVPLSILAYLVFQRRQAYRYLFLSGIFLGLGLLTKYIANILFIYLLGLVFLEFLYRPKAALLSFAEHLRRSLINFAMLVFSAMATFYILLPAAWVDPEELWTATLASEAFVKVAPLFGILLGAVVLDSWLNRSRFTTTVFTILSRFRLPLAWLLGGVFFAASAFVLANVLSGMRPYNFIELLGSPKTIGKRSDFIGAFLTNFYPLVFGIHPLVLLGLLLTPLFFLRKRFFHSESLRLSFYLIIFILLYYLGATVNSVGSIVRYQIIIFPLAAIIAGIGLLHLSRLIEGRYKLKKGRLAFGLAVFIGLTGTITLFHTPFPLSYASSLLPKKYYIDLKDMGPGSYEIAEQLNTLPNAKNLLIWTDKDGVCQFFVGRCKRGNTKEVIYDDSYDYIVVSSARKTRTSNMFRSKVSKDPEVLPVNTYYDRNDEAFAVFINGRPSHYVKAFRYENKRANPFDELPPSPDEANKESSSSEEEEQ